MEQEVLQRLLQAEAEAEALAQAADAERERMIQEAQREAEEAERGFEQRLPSIRSSFVDKALARAEQTLIELKRRYEEHHAELRTAAEENEAEAVDNVLAVILDPERN